MTAFTKTNLIKDGAYLQYVDGNDRRFVARFKYSTRDLAGFRAFLIKNFTVEEYMHRLDAREAPSTILESKGYVSLTVRRTLERCGYEPTPAGREAYIKAQVDKAVALRNAAVAARS